MPKHDELINTTAFLNSFINSRPADADVSAGFFSADSEVPALLAVDSIGQGNPGALSWSLVPESFSPA
ncbi:hypothetical protein CDA63_10395 [Hymenobacter amundsenii]|uniref:Uncharacterized protein n=1 Tax=Hymenobacter amundsenii TaxID=2006685 RepID=A0A246FKM3_9BACT|nr:hypothetical protein CDA63_10395 [Hymenobacter amundsenii]